MKKLSLFILVALPLVAAFAADTPLKDGAYSGKSGGHNGPVQVAVVVRKGRIDRVEVTRHKEKRKKALSTIPGRIVAKQSVKVDAVSGATVSSKAIMNAVKNALEQAR